MKEREMVTYVTVPVKVRLTAEDTYEVIGVDLTDDGDPGSWGNTYVYDPFHEDGEWFFDSGAQHEAATFVYGRLNNQIGRQLRELALLSERGLYVGDLLEGIASILEGTHVPSPDGLREVGS